MPLTINTNNPDSLQTLLVKANVIQTTNKENLTYIQSFKGKKTITYHRCNLQNKTSPNNTQKTHHHDSPSHMSTDVDNQPTAVFNYTASNSIDDIISSWRYKGKPLKRERIAISSIYTYIPLIVWFIYMMRMITYLTNTQECYLMR